MAYIDETYYLGNGGKAGDYSPALADRVSDLIDAVTFRAVERYNLEGTKLFGYVQRACLSQMLFVASAGGLEAWEGNEQMQSESIGNYSYNRKADGGRAVYDGLALAPSFLSILAPVTALGRKLG